MPVEIKMPQMGESITEGTIVRWCKSIGDRVERDETLLEISTDKVDSEVPSPSAGYLSAIYVEEGETVPVRTTVALLSESADEASSDATAPPPGETSAVTAQIDLPGSEPAESESAKTGVTSLTPSPERKPLQHSPAVRRLLAEHKLDATAIPATGESGRLTRRDVEHHIATQVAENLSSGNLGDTLSLEDRIEPLGVMRQQIAARMVESKNTSPHVSTVHEIDMTEVASVRSRLKKTWESSDVKVTYLAFVLQAIAESLREHPLINASLEVDKIHYHGDVNLGIAVALDKGLIVPVIRQADKLSILELSQRIQDLATRARSKKLQPDEVQNGTFTITNPGVFGSIIGMPIIPQPQSAILCLGAVKKRVVVLPGDAIGIRSMSFFTLTFDHRLIDGANADQFLFAVTRRLEAGKFRIEP